MGQRGRFSGKSSNWDKTTVAKYNNHFRIHSEEKNREMAVSFLFVYLFFLIFKTKFFADFIYYTPFEFSEQKRRK